MNTYGINSIACVQVHIVSDMLTEATQEFELYVFSNTAMVNGVIVELSNIMKPTRNATVTVDQNGDGEFSMPLHFFQFPSWFSNIHLRYL